MTGGTHTVPETILSVRDLVLVVELSGSWRLTDGIRDFASDIASDPTFTGTRNIRFSAADLKSWDSSLLVYVQQVADYADEAGMGFDYESLPPALRKLLSLARAVPEKVTRGLPPKRGIFERLGFVTVRRFEHLGEFLHFSATSLTTLFKLLIHTKRFRWRELWPVIMKTGPQALGLVALIAFMVGAILAFLGYYVLAQFGASIYIVYIVGFGVLREMGPLMTAIIIAGRTGAAYAAEIGSMKASEELDAYSTMGIDPIDIVVMPRLLALFFMMPVLTVYADAIGILGGLSISLLLSDITLELFIDKFLSDINLFQFGIGIFKGTIFGVLVGLSGCLRGLQSGKSADAVGQATTSAVVTGITLIIAANFLIDFVITMLDL